MLFQVTTFLKAIWQLQHCRLAEARRRTDDGNGALEKAKTARGLNEAMRAHQVVATALGRLPSVRRGGTRRLRVLSGCAQELKAPPVPLRCASRPPLAQSKNSQL